ncbi:hypothetical protein [Paralimibaculum aggregatum]|nr:hypothetical protein [Limibaculum sp. NKW23]
MHRLIVSILMAFALLLPPPAMAGMQHGTTGKPIAQGADPVHGMHCTGQGCGDRADEAPPVQACCDDAIGHCAATGLPGPASVTDCGLSLGPAKPLADPGRFLRGLPGAMDPPPPRR